MRDSYHRRLDVLVLQVARMCDLAATAMDRATAALLEGDLRLAERVVADDVLLNDARDGVEQDAHLLLALQSPVATDLRAVVSALHSAEDIERMGDLAGHVAAAVHRRHPEPVLPPPLHSRFEQMGELAVRLATDAGQVVRTGDVRGADRIGAADDEMDGLHRSLFGTVAYRGWAYGVPVAVDAALLSRCYERFADHAVTVARRAVFVRTGEMPRRADPGPVESVRAS